MGWLGESTLQSNGIKRKQTAIYVSEDAKNDTWTMQAVEAPGHPGGANDRSFEVSGHPEGVNDRSFEAP